MFIVTNRRVESGEKGLDQFGSSPSDKGPHELRLFEAVKDDGDWKVQLLPDRLSRRMKEEVGLPVSKSAFASQYVAAKLLKRLRDRDRNLLFFVHGFNNDVEAVLERAAGFEANYNVEVIPFSWPANGGGVSGVASYKSDKRDARASVGAVYRAMAKTRRYLNQFNQDRIDEIQKEGLVKFPQNMEKRQQFLTRAADKGCPFTVNLALHSMGNYLFKQICQSNIFDEHHMLFDNVVMMAADTNNEGHASWVDRIRSRRRVFITINEDDSALRASRIKSGDDQLARLGHYPHDLNSRQALYADFTDADEVDSSHAYFEGDPIKDRNGPIYKFFHDAFNGRRGEDHLVYDGATNTWRTTAR